MSTDTLSDSDPEGDGALPTGVASVKSNCAWGKSTFAIRKNENSSYPGTKSAADAKPSKEPFASPSVTTKLRGETNAGGHRGLAAAPLSKLRNATGPFLQKYLEKIHEAAGHLTSSQMRQQLVHVWGLPAGTWRMIAKDCGDCGVCEIFFPVCGTKGTHHFSQHVGMDLLFHYALALLHVVDVHTHFNAVRLVSRKKSAVALDCFRNMWLLPYGAPKKIPLDTGWELSSDAYAEE